MKILPRLLLLFLALLASAPAYSQTTYTDRFSSSVTSIGIKAPCRVATTANLTALRGLLTIDSVTLAEGQRVLVKNQTDTTQNGIWNASALNWSRAFDFNGIRETVNGTIVYVTSGTHGPALYQVSVTDPVQIGTDAISFILPPAFSAASLNLSGALTVGGAVTFSTLNSAGVVTTDSSGVLSTNTYLPAARFPALTGNVTTSAGSTATTIGAAQVTNAMMVNSAVTIGSTAISLGGTASSLAGLTGVTATTFTGALSGNASTATTATNATNITTAEDGTTNAAYPVTFQTGTNGTNPLKTNSLKLTYNPSTGAFNVGGPVTANSFVGPITGAVTGNADTATKLITARNIGAVSFDGSTAIVPQTIQTVDDTSDTTMFVALLNSSGSQTSGQQPKTNSAIGVNASTGALSATSFVGAGTGLTGTAASLTAGAASAVAVGGITGLGTGVATALAINVGTAGAPVVLNGAGGTPSAITLTNGTGLPTTGLTGTLQAAQEPAHTGGVTNSAGSLALTVITNANMTGDVTSAGNATTIAANAVTLAKLATQATNTVLGNATSGSAVPTALAVGTCSTAGSALIWTTNTGFGCNTSITAAAVPASGITGATLASNVTAASIVSLPTITTGVWNAGAVTSSGQVAGTSFAPSSTSGIIGTTTNNNAAAGSVGEIICSSVATGSGVALTTATAVQVTNISLTAGDWEVYGQVEFTGATTTTVVYQGGQISTTNNSVADAQSGYTVQYLASAVVFNTTNPVSYSISPVRATLAGTTTYYLNAVSSFAVSTQKAFGGLCGRRLR